MTMGSSSIGITEVMTTSVPMFKGDGYYRWSVKMETLFRSQKLWKIVEEGPLEEGIEA